MNPTATQQRFLFVGQRPSKRAEAIGATWQNGKLAACTLWKALEALGMDPAEQTFINIWATAEPRSWADELVAEANAHGAISEALARGYIIIGMGAVVHAWLDKHGFAYVKMTHPAARGAIRRQERYHRHVAEVLLGEGVAR